MWPGMIPILHLPGEMIPGQFGPIRRVLASLQKRRGADHVECGNAFGDADDQFDAGIGRFHDGVGRKRRRNENDGRVGAGLAARFVDGVEDIDAFVFGAAFAGRDAADNLACRTSRPEGVKRSFFAGESLNQQPCVLVDQYAHRCSLLLPSRGDDFLCRVLHSVGNDEIRARMSAESPGPVRRSFLPAARQSEP